LHKQKPAHRPKFINKKGGKAPALPFFDCVGNAV